MLLTFMQVTFRNRSGARPCSPAISLIKRLAPHSIRPHEDRALSISEGAKHGSWGTGADQWRPPLPQPPLCWMYDSPHSFMAERIGINVWPKAVSEHSTRGGTSAHKVALSVPTLPGSQQTSFHRHCSRPWSTVASSGLFSSIMYPSKRSVLPSRQ